MKDLKPNKVFVRSYCESGCDCPDCHTGEGESTVEDCVYCQLKWAGKGEYDPKYRNKKGWSEPKETRICKECGTLYVTNPKSDNKEEK